MTKRLTALLLILLLALSAAAGCTPKTTTEQPDNATPSPTPSVEQSVPSSSAGDEIVQEEVKIPFGLYRITSTDGKVLSYGIKTNKINYTATDYQERCWTVESFRAADGKLGYTLYAGDLPKSALTLERLLPGGTSKIQPASAVNPDSKQKFMVEEAGDGTFILRSFTNPKFALSSGTDSPTLVAYEEGGENIKWKFEALTEGCDRYVEWRSEGGIFTVRMGPDILQRAKISSERMQEWANDMEKTYYSYIELTGFIPYQHIIFKAYESEEYPGYVMGDYMVISADMVFMYDDIAKMALRDKKCNVRDYNFLLLDEPSSHLDTFAQQALETALRAYRGAVLMVSHDFYHIAACADQILYVENGALRPMSPRAFRKMIYKHHFHKDYLELEQQRVDLETRTARALEAGDCAQAQVLCEHLGTIVEQMQH